MFFKTKENKQQNNKRNVWIILLIISLVILTITILLSNRRTVLDKVGNIFNVKETNKTGEILNNETGTQTISTENWDLEKVNIVYDKDNVAVPVPKGYVASSVENGVTPIGQEIAEENRVSTGFVIYEMTAEEIENGIEVSITKDNFWEESQKRNQWVWVPVPDTSRIYERNDNTGKVKSKLYSYTTTGRTTRSTSIEPGMPADKNYDTESFLAVYGIQGITKVKLIEELESEYEATIESIEKYGGFYIGRYETGNVSNLNKKPVVQRMNTNINYVTWYDAYNNMKNIQRNENIKSNIIWGCLWDETLQWLVDSGGKTYLEIKNPADWGNHSDSDFDYITIDGIAKHIIGGTRVPTGSCEHNKANNIYDMSGNMFELTLETQIGECIIIRGGASYGAAISYPVDCRFNTSPTQKTRDKGVRAYFYIK